MPGVIQGVGNAWRNRLGPEGQEAGDAWRNPEGRRQGMPGVIQKAGGRRQGMHGVIQEAGDAWCNTGGRGCLA